MNPTRMRATITTLDVLYVRSDPGNTFRIVCDPKMSATQQEVLDAIEALCLLEGVAEVSQDAESTDVVINVVFGSRTPDAQKFAAYEILAPRYICGRAWGAVVRGEDGKHINTVLRFEVDQRLAVGMVEKLSAIDTIAQFATDEHYGNGRWSTSIGFTMQQPPTRDPAANRAVAVIIAGELGIMLDDERFTVKDNLAYACMPECNHENDPIDQKPSAI